MDRRAALRTIALGVPAALAGRALAAQQGQGRGAPPDSALGQLVNPDWAGRAQGRVTAYDNDDFVIAVEQKLRCTCGCNLSVYTCRTTDFTCTTSPAMHRRVIALVQQRQTAEQILAAFVAQNGETVLMAPPRVGFNLAAYFVPGSVIALVAGLLLAVVVRRGRARAVPAGTGGGDIGLSPTDADRLAAELRQLDR